MTESIANKKRRFRFSLAFVLVVFAVTAVLLTFGRTAYDWYSTIPTIPLADVVASFNSRSASDPVGQHESPLTEQEIVDAIRLQLPNLRASNQVKAILSKIASTKQLPHDARVYAMSGWTLRDGTHYTVWWINLDVKVGSNSGFGLRIRENNQPTAKPLDEPKLERRNSSWVRKPSQ